MSRPPAEPGQSPPMDGKTPASPTSGETPRAMAAPAIPEKPEKPRPTPRLESAFASKGYFLQLGAFASETNAKVLLGKAQAAGFQAGLTDSNGQYRVRVGPIQDRVKALETLARLKAKGFHPVIIGP